MLHSVALNNNQAKFMEAANKKPRHVNQLYLFNNSDLHVPFFG